MVLAAAGEGHLVGLLGQRLRQRVTCGEGHGTPDRAVGQGRAVGEGPGKLAHDGRKLLGTHDAADQAELERLGRRDGPREHQQILGLGDADQLRQGPAGSRVAGQGDAGERQVEAAGVDHDAQVGGEREGGAGACGHAVDRGDDGLVHGREQLDDRVVVLGHRRPQRLVAAREQTDVLAQVLAHAEGPPGARQHHAADGGVLGHPSQGREQDVLGGDVQRVHCLGTVQRDGGDAVGEVQEHRSGQCARGGCGCGIGLGHVLSAPCSDVLVLCEGGTVCLIRISYWGTLAR